MKPSTTTQDRILLAHVLARHLARLTEELARETRPADNPAGDDAADAARLAKVLDQRLRAAHRLCPESPTTLGQLRAAATAAGLAADDAGLAVILAAGLRNKHIPPGLPWVAERSAAADAKRATHLDQLGSRTAASLSNLFEVHQW